MEEMKKRKIAAAFMLISLAALIVVGIVYIFVAHVGESEEDKALRLIKGYGKDIGGPETIETCTYGWLYLNTNLSSEGWYIGDHAGSLYQVNFAYREGGYLKFIAWKIDLNTNEFISMDDIARHITELAKTS